jgi:hypothetical protein
MTGLFGSIGFAAPWLLWALLPLPVIWLILRIIPPAPVLRRFPGVVLLLGLADRENAAARTPFWLLLLRVLALAAAIVGFAGPTLNPEARGTGGGPLLILADATWADAPDWQAKRRLLLDLLEEARRGGRPAAVLGLTAAEPVAIAFTLADDLIARTAAFEPEAWEPDEARLAAVAAALPEGGFETVWLSDGLERPGRAELAGALAAHGRVTVYEGGGGILAVRPAGISEGKVATTVLRPKGEGTVAAEVSAIGLDPTGAERELGRQAVTLTAGETQKLLTFDLQPEVRNRITRLELTDGASAGSVALADDALKRRKVALVEGGGAREGLELLSPGHYLRQALKPNADLIEGGLADLLAAAPEVVILADVARLPSEESDRLTEWVEEGGLLVRFAGPRLAGSVELEGTADPLLPVTLRPGGRTVGGTMSWGAPRALAPFPDGSPFEGLRVPAEVAVSAQVLAEPGPDLADRTIAALDDGTPLVTRAALGGGQVVLFHVTANAEWSGLPLSGLFVDMLDRLAISSRPHRADDVALAGTVWQAERVLDAYGILAPVDGAAGVPGERLAAGRTAADMPPGLYASDDRRMALNVIGPERALAPAAWPAGVAVRALVAAPELPLKGWLLAAALALVLADAIATLALSGRFARPRPIASALVLGLALAGVAPRTARAEGADEAERLAQAANGMLLAYVETGDPEVDEISRQGLDGLSFILASRTSVEPGLPVAVNLDRDDISVLPFLYWPITPDQPAPSPAAYRKLERFMKTGGLILFDTRDADFGAGGTTPERRRLQEIAAPLDIPPLEPVPADHVLTRSFYLIQDFPGRYAGPGVWVEAAPSDAEKAEGMPFRNLNDGVTPVVIGGNDWAAAWAMDENGYPVFPVGRGLSGERQREIAFRFGVNLIMHVMTGNYKSDQVHVPALLERLGQ